MTAKYSGATLLLAAAMLLPALASAQVASSNYVSVSSVPSTLSYAPGTTGATLGTVTLTATEPGSYQIASLPLTLSTNGSDTASDLSSCQLINSSGSALNTNANELNSLNLGTNTFVFDSPLAISNGSPVTLSVRCNLSSAMPTGTTFDFTGGSPIFAPSLMASMTTFPSVTPGEVNAPIAAITLNPGASSANVNVTSLPLSATYSNGLIPGDLSNCHIGYSGSVLDSNESGIINSGADTFTLNAPLSATAGGSALPLILSCNVASSAPVGGSLALSLAPAGILAADASTGGSITPTQGFDPTTGDASALGGTTTVVAPGNTTTTTVIAPNTGAGADAGSTIALMLAALLAGLIALGYLGYTRRVSTNK